MLYLADVTPPVLETLARWEPSAPRLTWYGEAGERVDLSGRVLANWVVKAANLLFSECAAAPGSSVHLSLPAHWRLLVWGLGAWAVGAEVTVGSERVAADVVVTDRPDRWADGAAGDLVAVTLPALAREWPTALPAGAIDGAAELMGQPDEPLFAAAPAPRRPEPAVASERRLLPASDPQQLLDRAWECWAAGGSVVVVTARDDGELEAIRRQEGVREP